MLWVLEGKPKTKNKAKTKTGTGENANKRGEAGEGKEGEEWRRGVVGAERRQPENHIWK